MLSDRTLQRRPPSHRLGAVRWLKIASVVGSLVALYLIIDVPPSTIWIRAALVSDFSLVATGIASLVAYRLSFRLSHSRRAQGNVSQSVRHGLVTGLVVLLLLSLQLLRMLRPFSLVVLVAVFVVGQVYVLLHRP